MYSTVPFYVDAPIWIAGVVYPRVVELKERNTSSCKRKRTFSQRLVFAVQFLSPLILIQYNRKHQKRTHISFLLK